MANHQLPVTPKVTAGVDGLDQILRGDLPAGRTTLIIGGPGAGTGLPGLELLCRSALAGQAGVFISFGRIGQLSTRRLRVTKYRGSRFGSNEYPFVIDPPGITLQPEVLQ